MVGFRVEGGIGPLIDYLAKLSELDVRPLAEECRGIAIEDNRLARTEGVDKDGQELAPLRGGRSLRPSEIRSRGGSGPPLAPRGEGSRVVTGYVAEVVTLDDGTVMVEGKWPDLDFLKYHVAGGPHLPRRDIAGLTPAGMDRVADATRRFVAEKLGLY